jgi:hypothetical protein
MSSALPVRRIANLSIDELYLPDFLAGRVCIPNIPKDAKFIRAAYDVYRNSFILILESEEFEPVPLDREAPMLQAHWEVRRKE